LNFLAHALLAGNNPSLVVGGVVGDWIKGSLPGALPDDLVQGVTLHRAIDCFAESQPSFCRSRSRVSPQRRRYAGVLVDIFYDHLLAQNWHNLHHQPLGEYCATVYGLIHDRLPDLPDSSHLGLEMMATEDWLSSYAKIEGITDVLARMSRRVKHSNPLAQGEQEFLADVAGYTADFYDWLDDAQSYCQHWREREGI